MGSFVTARGVRASVRAVVLFGSQARGDARPDSDLDLLFIPDGPHRVADVESTVADMSAELKDRLGLRLAGIVIPAARVQERFLEGDPLMEAVRAEGRGLLGEPFDEVVEQWPGSESPGAKIAPAHRGTTM